MAQGVLPHAADAVIIGGGAIGTSIAFHLAEAGLQVVLLDKGELAGGSTGKAAGGARTQFATQLNMQLSLRSLELFARFAERPGFDIGFKQIGYLFLLTSDDLSSFAHTTTVQQSLGIDCRLVSPEEICQLAPLVNVEDTVAGSYTPNDACLDPEAVAQGYATAARSIGAHIQRNCSLTGVKLRRGRVHAVTTAEGDIATHNIICAAGAWSNHIGKMVGVYLDVFPQPQHVLTTDRVPGLSTSMPLVVDVRTGLYVHQVRDVLLIGMADPIAPRTFELTAPSERWLSAVADVVSRRLPRLASVGIRGSWTGLYDLTPDRNPIVGQTDEVDGFHFAVGFSGHGVMHAPVIGEIMRDMILGGEPEFDVSAFSHQRFESGKVVVEQQAI